MVTFDLKGCSQFLCTSIQLDKCLKHIFSRYAQFVQSHYWKIILFGFVFMALSCLGFKSLKFDKDLLQMWIMNTSRLHNETKFMDDINNEMLDRGSVETILQVSNDEKSVLVQHKLLEHLQLLKMIYQIRVTYKQRSYGLEDLCQRVHLPRLQSLSLELRQDIDNILPCRIISPINCFWDSSKLMDNNARTRMPSFSHQYKYSKIDWRIFNLQDLPNNNFAQRNALFFKKLFHDCGIGKGFIDKPCIDISDPFCPNKTQDPIDYEYIIMSNGGCSQIADKLYKSPHSILLGHNRRALQTMILLRSSSDILQSIDRNRLYWTASKVEHIIQLWQDKLRQTVISYNQERPLLEYIHYRNRAFQIRRIQQSSFFVFTNNSLNNALDDVNSDSNILFKYLILLGIMILFSVLVFIQSDNLVRSHSWLALVSVGLLCSIFVAALGISAATEIKFSLLTTQVAPFFLFGFSMDEILILTSRHFHYMKHSSTKAGSLSVLSKTLYDSGIILFMSFLIKTFAIVSGLFITVPLMFNFTVQIAIIVSMKTIMLILIYPCFLHLDAIRQHHNRVDLICCLVRRNQYRTATDIIPSIPTQTRTTGKSPVLASKPVSEPSNSHITFPLAENCDSISQNYHQIKLSDCSKHQTNHSHNNTTTAVWKYRISKTVVQIIALVPVQISLIFLLLLVISLGIYAAFKLNYGLVKQSIFPANTNEYNFVQFESREFQLNTFDVVVRDVNFLTQRHVLIDLHRDLIGLRYVSSAIPSHEFWMQSFIDWLVELQSDFDSDIHAGYLLTNGSWNHNISYNTQLAFTMLVQDGDYINLQRLSQFKLIYTDGSIDPDRFHFYLNVWASVHPQFDSMPCVLYPRQQPINIDFYLPNYRQILPGVVLLPGFNLQGRRRPHLEFVSCKYLHQNPSQSRTNNNRNKFQYNFFDTTQLVTSVQEIRALLDRYHYNHHLNVHPLGIIFSLTEQYIHLKLRLGLSCITTVVSITIITLSLLHNARVCLIILLAWTISCLALMTFMWIIASASFYTVALPLNATSASLVIWCGVINLGFTMAVLAAHSNISCSTETSVSDTHALSSSPSISLRLQPYQIHVLHQIITNNCLGRLTLAHLLSIIFLALNNVSFIKIHFFLLPLASISISLFVCGLCVPLALVHLDCPESPGQYTTVIPDTPQHQISSYSDINNNKLSTIAEESSSYQSNSPLGSANSVNNNPPYHHHISSKSTTNESSISVSSSSTFPTIDSIVQIKYPIVHSLPSSTHTIISPSSPIISRPPQKISIKACFTYL